MKEEEKIQNSEEGTLNQQEKEQLEGGSDSGAASNERLDLSEMEEAEGGKNHGTVDEVEKEEGSGGGLICWC